MKNINQAKGNRMRSIRISDDLVLQLHPEPMIVKTSANWTDAEQHDPGIVLLEMLVYALTDLAYSEALKSRLIELKPSLLKLHEKVRVIEELLSRLLAEQSGK
jgi:hypothetical protein